MHFWRPTKVLGDDRVIGRKLSPAYQQADAIPL